LLHTTDFVDLCNLLLVWPGACKSIRLVIKNEVSLFVINKKANHLAKISFKYLGIYEVKTFGWNLCEAFTQLKKQLFN